MSFRSNSYQQLSLTDSIGGLTTREQKALERSWAKVFAEDIFPSIDEEPFRILYSSSASRPNTPVNVCIGALIIKEVFGISDDEIVENLMLDPRYQYALHTTSCEEQPLSDKTLSRFRKRCYDYESVYGIDLLHDCITGLGSKIAKMMDINPRIKRMDSMMIAANIRKLSRTELLYTCVAKLVLYFHKNKLDDLIKGLEHYYDPNDYNKTFYYNTDTETDSQLKNILDDADKLISVCGSDYDDVTEYQLLVRCLSEQTVIEDAKRRLRTKEDGGFHSEMLQNPSDPDATYRTKAGKEHQGYVANLEETVGKNGTVITDYQYEQNNYSDSQFLKDSLERNGVQEEETTLVADGAYSGKENRDLAAEKNIRLVNTDLTGKPVDAILADFVFNEEGTRVLRCPAGYEPKSCGYTGTKGQQFHVSFTRDQCAGCPNKDRCKAKIHKRVSSVTVSIKAHESAKQQRFMESEEFRNLFKIRNGVETVPSMLRRQYHVDEMPVRGLIRGRFFFGCKIGALNFKKLFTYRKGLGHYAQNPILT
ncbi:MAG: transposase [Lachnospiraceae bacterium]|nr:transposase [Lachnospiraceae bacterium]